RESLGMILEQAAEAIRNLSVQGFDPPRATFQVIGRHERGETYPGARYRRAYCLIYSASAAELGFDTATTKSEPESVLDSCTIHGDLGGQLNENWRSIDEEMYIATPAWDGAATARLVHQFTREDFSLDRRGVARSVTAVFVGSALLEPIERWLGAMSPSPSAVRAELSPIGYQELAQIEHA